MSNSDYHQPVLLRESVDALVEDINGVYVDVTFGGGGHSREVLSRLGDKGKLIAFDCDEDAQSNMIDDPRFTLVPSDFRFMQNHLRFLGHRKVDGILADLGVSSHQFDVPERGFSIRTEGELDMRMGKTTELTAAKVVNKYDEEELIRVLKNYGELTYARKLASIIVSRRNEQKFQTTEDLVLAIEKVFPPAKRMQNLAKVFQGIRIEVNDEMGSLQALLRQSVDVLKPAGNLVVIAYHSLEDRPVKRFMRAGNSEGEVKKDFFGNPERPFTPLAGKPITPSKEEIERNNRARSAKLRVAKRND
ncbi:MAG: 16S rRNA (cytosine1402-N4)-methyltransferase [Cryomorphaceae bacterium]|jgi:16S rRNA (cytosine1402-N4)-methyltransferase